jgi:hypothetical protein
LRKIVRAAPAGAALGEGSAVLYGQRLPAPARGWRREEPALRGGNGGGDHEVSILIRLGAGEGAGRGLSKVSTMIIRPPQHGHRRADEGVSACSEQERRLNLTRPCPALTAKSRTAGRKLLWRLQNAARFHFRGIVFQP